MSSKLSERKSIIYEQKLTATEKENERSVQPRGGV